MEQLTLKDVLDLGLQGASIVAIVALWKRLSSITDRLFGYLEAAKTERHRVYNEMTTRNLSQDVKDAKNGV